MMDTEMILVTAPNEAGRKFVKLLMYKKMPFAVLTNSAGEERKLRRIGVEHVIRMNTAAAQKWFLPQASVGNVFIFENSLNLTCRYLQIVRSWTSKPLCVITEQSHPKGIYRGMGADKIVYSLNGEVGFLLNGCNIEAEASSL
ncbi:hypothetical protein [Paenibacillus barcinonensis]|nr:hypothetical protein [Paenibacillus barcinonensis]